MGLKELGAYLQLGEKLKNARKTSGRSQKDFAAALGVPASTYSNYENGNRIPPAAVLNKVSEILKIPMHNLFSIGDPPAPSIVFHDWLSSVGYDIVLYEEEDWRSLNIRDRSTWDSYALSDSELDLIREKVIAFTRFQIAEFINARKPLKTGGNINAKT